MLESRAYFEEICEYHKELADNAGLGFSCEISSAFPETFTTDPKLFKKICNNIVGNAVKFTKEGQVTLSATIEGNEYVVSISDTGIGIPKKNCRSSSTGLHKPIPLLKDATAEQVLDLRS